MSHEILSVKLCELDKKYAGLHGRIHMSEMAGYEQLHDEVEALKRECAQEEMELCNKLQYSRSEMVAGLADAYRKMEEIVRQTREEIGRMTSYGKEDTQMLEEKLLLAEYSLDFAIQAANRALLISLEAIEEQLKLSERKERNVL